MSFNYVDSANLAAAFVPGKPGAMNVLAADLPNSHRNFYRRMLSSTCGAIYN